MSQPKHSIDHRLQLNFYNYFTRTIHEHQDTSLCYNSKFRSLDDLSSIYENHDTFSFFTNLHQQRTDYVFTMKLSEDERIVELKANITRGNHYLATKWPLKLERNVQYGFSIPAWVSSLSLSDWQNKDLVMLNTSSNTFNNQLVVPPRRT